FTSSLRRLIAHCMSPGVFGYTPSDFPLAKLDQASLDRHFGTTRGLTGVYPLSPLQAGMLFHALQDPGSPTDTVQQVLEVGGVVDEGVLSSAWDLVVARHDTLRTSLLWQDVPEPLQVVHAEVPFAVQRQDWSSLPAGEAEARWESFLAEDR